MHLKHFKLDVLSATFPLPDYGRVARHPEFAASGRGATCQIANRELTSKQQPTP